MGLRRLIAPAACGFAVVAAAAVVGHFPTRRLAGEGGVEAMLAGCGVGLLSNWIGLGAWALAASGGRQGLARALLLATAVRFLAVLMLTLAAALSGLFSQAPLLIWIGLSYLVALATETLWLVRLDGRLPRE